MDREGWNSLSPFPHSLSISSPFPHSLSISSSFSHSLSIFSQPGCQAATSCATLRPDGDVDDGGAGDKDDGDDDDEGDHNDDGVGDGGAGDKDDDDHHMENNDHFWMLRMARRIVTIIKWYFVFTW